MAETSTITASVIRDRRNANAAFIALATECERAEIFAPNGKHTKDVKNQYNENLHFYHNYATPGRDDPAVVCMTISKIQRQAAIAKEINDRREELERETWDKITRIHPHLKAA